MNPINITPQRALDDALRMQQKIAAGLKTLREVGDVQFGVTDKEEIYREDKLVLYRFKGEGTPRIKTPLLIVYALVNRPYMVDLQEDRSIVRQLLASGHDVYLIDWGYPDLADRFTNLDDYINGYIRRCVDVVARRCAVRFGVEHQAHGQFKNFGDLVRGQHIAQGRGQQRHNGRDAVACSGHMVG